MAKGLMENIYNPDVLSCIANLSSDEVFTPPEVANAMLDMLPKEVFESKETKFLDPACKSGVFLREIAKRLIRAQFPDYESKTSEISEKKNNGEELTIEERKYIEDLQKGIDHVFKNQLYGIAITELTSLLSRRSVYCSKFPNSNYSVTKFDNAEGNIYFGESKHLFINKKCLDCGASEEEYGPEKRKGLESHAYQFIHPRFRPGVLETMKFDVIIGNPPYQLSTGSKVQATPLYNLFVEQAKKLNPRYLTMIIPSRWFAGGMGLKEFRKNMLNDSSIRKLVDYPNAKDCFPGNSIGGGVAYFLWDRDNKGDCEFTNVSGDKRKTIIRKLNEFDIFVRYSEALSVIHKIQEKKEPTLETIISSLNPYNLGSAERGFKEKSKNDLILYSSAGKSYYRSDLLTQGKESVSKYKILMSKVTSEHAGEPGSDGKFKVISRAELLKPNEICTFSYFIIGNYDNENEAKNLLNYLKTNLVRFLLLQAISSINISKEKFCFVPLQDFTEEWDDEKLYKKYNISESEQSFINSMIRPID